MIKSMSGFGRAKDENFVIEIKSLNSRFCEVEVKIGSRLMALEEKIKTKIKERVSRGRLTVFVRFDASLKEEEIEVNLPLAKSYFNALDTLSNSLGIPNQADAVRIANLKNVLVAKEVEEDLEGVWEKISAVLEEALSVLVGMRQNEGGKIEVELLERVANVGKQLSEIEKDAKGVSLEYKAKLLKRLEELMEIKNLDEGRLEMEVALCADKNDISEEILRIKSHLDQFRELLSKDEPCGRRLDFLTQELLRETNTIGSKAQKTSITRAVLEIKNELEKMREQIQNVE